MTRRQFTEAETRAAARLREVWQRQRTVLDLKQDQVAVLCGWSGQSAFNNYLHARTPLNTDAVLKLARVLQVQPHELMPEVVTILPDKTTFEPGPDLPENWQKLPVVGVAQLGPEGYWVEMGNPVGPGEGYIEFVSRDPNAYVLRVKGHSMSPTIRSGWLVVVEPNSEYVNGTYVLVCTVDGRCMVKEFLFERDGEIALASINEDFARLTLSREEIDKIHAVSAIIPPHKLRPW